MKLFLSTFVLLGALACTAPDSESPAAPEGAAAVAETKLPVVRYYVIGDT